MIILQKHLEETMTQDKGRTEKDVEVFVDVASAMTGVSLFAQRHVFEFGCGIIVGSAGNSGDVLDNPRGWARTCRFVKAGYEEENSAIDSYSRFSHLLSEKRDIPGFHIVGTARGYPRLDIRRKQIVTYDAIFVMERDGWRDS